MDVVGKVMGQIIQEQFQVITEELLPDWISGGKRLWGYDFCVQIVDGDDKGK